MFNFMGKKEKKSRKGLSTSFANGEEIDNLEEVGKENNLFSLSYHKECRLN